MRSTTCLILLLLAAPSAASSDSTATLRGRVTFAPAHEPAGYALVIVSGTRRGAQADSSGAFEIKEVPAGTWTVRVRLPGFRQLTVPIEVRPGETVKDLELVLPSCFIPEPADIGARSNVKGADLTPTIRPAVKRFRVGDKLKFDVNEGTSPALLVTSVDASDAWASPSVNVEIKGPEGGFIVRAFRFCGNSNGVSLEDFLEVQPGDSFDPYAHGWLGVNLSSGTFQRPGRYEATFHYSTTERDPRRWVSNFCIDCPVPAEFYELLERVPAVDLVTRVEFDVEP